MNRRYKTILNTVVYSALTLSIFYYSTLHYSKMKYELIDKIQEFESSFRQLQKITR
jgi:hypothetical protein